MSDKGSSGGLLLGLAAVGFLLWRHQANAATLPATPGGGTPSGSALLPGGVPNIIGSIIGGLTSLLPGAPPGSVATPSVGPTTPTAGGGATSAPSSPAQPAPLPTVRGFSLSDQAMAKLGLGLTKEVTKWFLTPSEQSAQLSPEASAAWEEYKIENPTDFSTWAGEQTPPVDPTDAVIADNADVITAVEGQGAGLSEEAATALTNGTVEAVPMTTQTMGLLAPVLQAFGVAAAALDVGFTIAGKLPDAEKAVIAALDTAIAASLFIPVYGWAVGLVLGVVRGLLGMFGSSIFGDDLSHAQREAQEVAYTAQQGLNPWMQQVASCLTPRELIPVLIRWGTGYCGGTSSVAVMTSLTGTVQPRDGGVYIGSLGCYVNQGNHYHEWPNSAAMSVDDLATAIVKYGETEAHISVQAGVAQHYLDDMNTAGITLLQKRLIAWKEMMDKGLTLNDLDALALEQRKTPHWNDVAKYYGEPDWHTLVGKTLQDDWTRYVVTHRRGSLNDFAQKHGYPTWLTWRDKVMIDLDAAMTKQEAQFTQATTEALYLKAAALPSPTLQQWVPDALDADNNVIPGHFITVPNPAFPQVLVPEVPGYYQMDTGTWIDAVPAHYVPDPALLALVINPPPPPDPNAYVNIGDTGAGGGGGGGGDGAP